MRLLELTRMLLLLSHANAASDFGASPPVGTAVIGPPGFRAQPVPPNLPKVQLKLDPLAYRSASQGPVMPEELQPTSKNDIDQIDSVIERATCTHGWVPIIPQFSRSFRWAWQQWEGTIIERLWRTAVHMMFIPLCLLGFVRFLDPTATWWKLPLSHPLAAPLTAIANGWNYLLTLATFVTTFFVGHSHDFWCKSYGLTRSIQGRLNDIGLICGSHAQRTADGELTAEAAQLLDDTARNLRLMHCLVRPRPNSNPWRARADHLSPRLLCAPISNRSSGRTYATGGWARAPKTASIPSGCCFRLTVWLEPRPGSTAYATVGSSQTGSMRRW